MPYLNPPVNTLDRLTTAPAFYGGNLAWLLLGFILTQAYEYHIQDHRRDPWLLRFCVYGALFLTVSQTAVETYCGTYYFVQHWGQASAISTPPKPLVFQTLFDGIVGFMVQIFFLWRIWVFVRHSLFCRVLTVFAGLVSLLAFACSLAIPIIFVQVDNLALLKQKTGSLNIVWLAATAATDLFIAVYMLIILNNARSRISFSDTRDILSKYTRLTIQTGTLTFCAALMVLLIRLLLRVGALHTLGTYILGKSYVLSLLINLNATVTNERADRVPDLTLSPPRQPHGPTSDHGATTAGSLQFTTTMDSIDIPSNRDYAVHGFFPQGKTGSDTESTDAAGFS
ncbi:hypothetical protein K439DRAFT_1639844 [Ramaria rubella]|nr:hypothetical protein K439DRAFT_1639844 [Ramaria rubella]